MSDSITTTLHAYAIMALGVPATPELLEGMRGLYDATGDYSVVDAVVNNYMNSQATTLEDVCNQVGRVAGNGLGLSFDPAQAEEVTHWLVANGIDSWSEVFSVCSGLENQYGVTLHNRAMVAEAFTASLDTPEETAAYATPAGQFTMAAWLGGVTHNPFSRGMAQALLGDTLHDMLNPVSGVVQDGYLADATVFADTNGNGVLDSGEFATLTDPAGNYTLPAGLHGRIVASGGTDIATGLAFAGSFTAPAGSTVANPLTTLLVGLMAQGHGQSEAQVLLQSSLGLPAVDLTSFDPIAELSGGNSEQARAVLTAAVQVNNLLTIGGSALEGASNSLDAATAFGRMAEALVQQLDGATGALDLAGNTLMHNMLTDAADAGNVTLGASLAHEIAQLAANHNTAIAGLGSLEGDALLNRVMEIAAVSQGAAAEAVHAASTQGDASFGTVMGGYTFDVPDQTPVVPTPTPAPTPTPTPDPTPADTTPPVTTTAAAVSGTTAFTTTLAATVNENGTGYYLVQPAAAAAPNAPTVIAANHAFAMTANTEATVDITGLGMATAYKVYFVATDAVGNIQTAVGSVALTTLFPPDSTAPDAPTGLDLAAADDTGSSASDKITSTTTALTITGTAEAGSTVRLYDTDGTTLLGAATATGGVFSIDMSLVEGSHTLTARATDAANNTSVASAGLVVVRDTIDPTTTINSLAFSADTGENDTDFITNTAPQTITATLSAPLADDEMLLGSLDNGETWTDISDKVTNTALSWNGVNLAASNTLQCKVIDFAGNDAAITSQAYVLDIIDPDAPTGLDLAAADDSGSANSDNLTPNTTGLTISGSAEEDSTVKLYDTNGTTLLGTGTATGGIFSIDVSLIEGSHTITARATDAADNTSAASTGLTIAVDTTAPATTAAPSVSGTTASATTLAATINENGTGYYLIQPAAASAPSAATVIAANNSFAMTANNQATASISGLDADTAYTVYFAATDTAGNPQAAVGAVNVTTDASASHAGDAVIDLGSRGLLIDPVQVNGHWYYYWDRSGDGRADDWNNVYPDTGDLIPSGPYNDGVDYCSHDTLDAIFTEDVNGVVGGGGNTTNVYRYATINGMRVALPTQGDGGSVGVWEWYYLADNRAYTDYAEIWDTYNSGYATSGTPSGWLFDIYWSATPSGSGHAGVGLDGGVVSDYYDGSGGYVVLEVV